MLSFWWKIKKYNKKGIFQVKKSFKFNKYSWTFDCLKVIELWIGYVAVFKVWKYSKFLEKCWVLIVWKYPKFLLRFQVSKKYLIEIIFLMRNVELFMKNMELLCHKIFEILWKLLNFQVFENTRDFESKCWAFVGYTP